MSKKKPTLLAAGAVITRESTSGLEVLMVHRPRYDDWSLPKGKPNPDEDLAVTAVREVFEETGCEVRLGLPLSVQRYPTSKGDKTVSWWRGHLIKSHRWRPNDEVDQVAWLAIKEAMKRLTHEADRTVVNEALTAPPTGVLMIVRHGKAMDRKHWSGGKDWKRPIGTRGRRQAKRLSCLMSAYGIASCLTSSSTRCVQTFEPYAELAKVNLDLIDALSEESHDDNPAGVARVMKRIKRRVMAHPHKPLAVCGHRPVLPLMRESINAPAQPMLTGEAQVLHIDASGQVVAEERIKSKF